MNNVEWLSPSSINDFIQCPLKFKYQKIDKHPWEDTTDTLRGTYAHAILEKLFDRPEGARTFDAAREIAKDLWPEFEPKIMPLLDGQEAARKWRWEVWWCVDNYFGLEDPNSFNPVYREEWVRGNVGPAKVRGIIDRVDREENGIRPVDYKTGKKPARAEWEAGYRLQTDIYCILSEEAWGENVVGASLLYLKKGERSDFDFDEESRESAIKTVTAVREGIDERVSAEEFEPKTSKLCDWCSFKPICPAWN